MRKPLPRFSEAAEKIAQAMSLEQAPENSFKRWQSGELVIVSAGYSRHATSMIFYKDTFILCDLGGSTEKPFEVFTFDRKALNSSVFTEIKKLKHENGSQYE